ncbi:Notoamide biosynthesis transcriptional activator notL'-like protein [Cladobotryum mycophilum]|uniref:Notoamide biosynthesis transcriptional activator notL'-like protein n=1 Tax=Cladobotryum mycophilum TaxID=491253 RepID=A0ABR0T426_9HYPO
MQPLRRLLPRTHPDLDPSYGRHASKRRNISTACDDCRKRKAKCDGQRPACEGCIYRNIVCIYTPRKTAAAAAAAATATAAAAAAAAASAPHNEDPEYQGQGESSDIVRRLRSLPFEEAMSLLHELRQTNSLLTPQSIGVEDVEDAPVPAYLAPHGLIRSWIPSTSNDLEFELAVRYPIAYPTLFPMDATMIPIEDVLRPKRIRWLRRPSPSPPLGDAASETSSESQHSSSPPPDDSRYAGMDVSVVPAEAKAKPDPRLKNLNMKNWTDVPISNDLAAQIISFYLEMDYPVLPMFEAGLFIDNLINNRQYFCSRLLVASLMSWACQAYSAVAPESSALGAAFFLEAKIILETEKRLHTLTAVSAFQIMSMTAVTYGRDDLAAQYLKAGIRLGRLMGLFGVRSESQSAQTWLQGYPDWKRAAAYTAWGVFNWICLYGRFYQTAEIGLPPLLPKPAELERESLKSRNSSAEPSSTVEVFDASCNLWTIVGEVLVRFYIQNTSSTLRSPETFEFVEGVYRRLLGWAHNLPLCLVRNPSSNHAVFLLHIYFHAIVTDIFRPFLDTQPPFRFKTFSAPHASAEAAYSASVNQLKRLLLLYRLHCKRATLCILWQTGLIYVANAMMREAGTPGTEWRFYLNLCLAGFEDLYSCYRVFNSIGKGFLGMAFQRGAINAQDAKRIRKEMKVLGKSHSAVDELANGQTIANWIVEFDLALSDPGSARGTDLAKRFEELMLDDEADA